MEISSTALTAAILSFISTLLITQVIGRFIDHNYDKPFKELDKNLKINNALPDDMKSETLEQIIRQQLNAYILTRSQHTLGKKVMNRLWLAVLAGISAICGALAIWNAIDGRPWWSAVSIFGTLSFGAYYFDRRSVWTKTTQVHNTKYRAIFMGGLYSNGSVLIDIIQDGDSDIAIDYPRIAIIDDDAGKTHFYKRIRSDGTVSIDSGDNTSLNTTYQYEGTVTTSSEHRIHSKKQAVINQEDIKTSGVLYPKTEEIPLISFPIHEALHTGQRLSRLIKRKTQNRH